MMQWSHDHNDASNLLYAFDSSSNIINKYIYTVFQKKTCDHIFDDKLKYGTVRFDRFLAHLLPRVQAIDRCFYFPT